MCDVWKASYMVRNVKIDDETHRRLSIRASELVMQKGDLASALIDAALANMRPEELKDYIDAINIKYRNRPKKAHQNQDR
jgi:hypothetical protein